MHVTAIIVGAGSGRRMGYKNKPFLDLSGKPILSYTLDSFQKSEKVDEIILVVNDQSKELAENLIKDYNISKVSNIIFGGKERQDSIQNALNQISKSDIVLVHDAARPFVTIDLVNNIIKTTQEHKAAIPCIKVKDTIKQGEDFVQHTLNRSELNAVQTPQGFDFELLKEAYTNAKEKDFLGTDDASLVEFLGRDVKIVEGIDHNIKITVPFDMIIAEQIVKHLL